MSDTNLTPVPDCDGDVIVGLPPSPPAPACGQNSVLDPMERIIALEKTQRTLESEIGILKRQVDTLNRFGLRRVTSPTEVLTGTTINQNTYTFPAQP